ncbi:MAG: hypothetical protein AAFQ78_03480, partial [Bacteroidota bacterium]
QLYMEAFVVTALVELALIDLAQLQEAPSGVSAPPPPKVHAVQPTTSTKADTVPKPIPTSLPSSPTLTPPPVASAKQQTATVAPSPTTPQDRTLQATTKLPKIDQLKADLGQREAPAPATLSPISAPSQPLTKEAVRQQWQAYAQKLRQAGNMAAYSVLGNDIQLAESTITVQLVNSVQQDILNSLKEDLMATLRRALQHPTLELRAVVATDKKTKRPYTAQEKFTYLAEKHPAIWLLQEKLALEVQD